MGLIIQRIVIMIECQRFMNANLVKRLYVYNTMHISRHKLVSLPYCS